jgi:hypothetical protein
MLLDIAIPPQIAFFYSLLTQSLEPSARKIVIGDNFLER